MPFLRSRLVIVACLVVGVDAIDKRLSYAFRNCWHANVEGGEKET